MPWGHPVKDKSELNGRLSLGIHLELIYTAIKSHFFAFKLPNGNAVYNFDRDSIVNKMNYFYNPNFSEPVPLFFNIYHFK